MTLFSYLYLFVSLILAITFHECSHAYVASVLGDPTAKLKGRVSLNPIRHLDLVGTIMIIMTFVSGFGIGWGKPVPVNPYNFRDYKKGEALTALAGPMANFLLALVASFFIRFLGDSLSLYFINFLQVFVMLNVGLMSFNLIPVPPLDGSKILFMFLPDRYYHLRARLEHNGAMILFGAIIVSQILGIPLLQWILGPIMNFTFFLLGVS